MPRRPKKHPGGRPPLPPGEARSARLPPTPVTDEERARAVALAREHGLTLAEWVRRRVTTTGASE